jgi:hypothetical protein
MRGGLPPEAGSSDPRGQAPPDASTSRAAAGAAPPLARREGYRLEVVQGELLLFDPGRATVLYCNQTAALVWALCDGARSVDEIVALLAGAFPGAGAALEADVRETVQRLVSHGVVALC